MSLVKEIEDACHAYSKSGRYNAGMMLLPRILLALDAAVKMQREIEKLNHTPPKEGGCPLCQAASKFNAANGNGDD